MTMNLTQYLSLLALGLSNPSSDQKSKPQGYLYTGRDGLLRLELIEDKPRKKPMVFKFDYHEGEKFANTLKIYGLTALDATSKMQGYTWSGDWQEFVYENTRKVYQLH